MYITIYSVHLHIQDAWTCLILHAKAYVCCINYSIFFTSWFKKKCYNIYFL